MALVCIGLGSNTGDRKGNLLLAYERIISLEDILPLRLSRFYETAPVGGPPQPDFLNAALSIETGTSPCLLLTEFQHIENSMGRVRTAKWGPRNIDIDILLYGDKIIHEDHLKIPHPLMHTRLFVLEPLSEIEPDAVHPVLNKTVSQLWKELQTSLAIMT